MMAHSSLLQVHIFQILRIGLPSYYRNPEFWQFEGTVCDGMNDF